MTRFDRTRTKTSRARKLRQETTPHELKLWLHLRKDQLGVSFRRQHPIGPYVIDFYCPSEHLAIELDGEQHGNRQAVAYDRARTLFLKRKGIRIIRFWNGELRENLEGVLSSIDRAIARAKSVRRKLEANE